jgi:hypothetical protein
MSGKISADVINRNYRKTRCDTDQKVPSEEKGMGETKPV